MKTRMMIYTAALLVFMASGAAITFSHGGGTTVTGVTGTIASVNYNEDGTVNGFVVGTSLLSFSDACGGVASLGVAGNSVTYSGTSRTEVETPTPLSTVSVTAFTNTTTSAVYTKSTSTKTPYSSAGGTVGALNYDSSGEVNGFLFTSTVAVTGFPATVLVITGSEALEPTFPATITSIIGSGRTSSCPGSPLPFVVEATSLNSVAINGEHGDH